MALAAKIPVALVAALHAWIAWFEAFAWTTRGPRVFTTLPSELFEPTVAMAANRGVYNAFLVVGLVWGLLIRDPAWSRRVLLCFLGFVTVAGLVGAVTVSPRIALVQGAPALLAIVLILLSRPRVAGRPVAPPTPVRPVLETTWVGTVSEGMQLEIDAVGLRGSAPLARVFADDADGSPWFELYAQGRAVQVPVHRLRALLDDALEGVRPESECEHESSADGDDATTP